MMEENTESQNEPVESPVSAAKGPRIPLAWTMTHAEYSRLSPLEKKFYKKLVGSRPLTNEEVRAAANKRKKAAKAKKAAKQARKRARRS